ncbi:hypothetical protein B0H14DRAFT_2576222 [Mycena olivaceomarginata]|nr:hypothetical protein B0H14DRAFT_2576222 [Mycena olivaceomarginata]
MVLLGADDNSAPTLIDDRETVVLWGKACESLRSIVLHGREWKLMAELVREECYVYDSRAVHGSMAFLSSVNEFQLEWIRNLNAGNTIVKTPMARGQAKGE